MLVVYKVSDGINESDAIVEWLEEKTLDALKEEWQSKGCMLRILNTIEEDEL